MPHRKLIAFGALVALLLLVFGLGWESGRMDPAPHRLRIEPGDGSITPLFGLITHGRLHTNYVTTAPGVKVAHVGYIHIYHYASQEGIQPASALRYRLGQWLAPALRWLRVEDKFVGSKSESFADTASVLWLGYRATNSLFSEEAILLSDEGSRIPLTPEIENALTNSQHLMSWEMPAPLTNPGKYRLTLPKRNKTLLTFVYP